MGKLSMFGTRQRSSVLMLALTLCAAVFGGTLAAVCNAGDKQALLLFKSQLIDSRNALAPWTPSSNCCQWPGITCNAAGQRVTKVELLVGFEFLDYKLKVKRNIRGAGASLGALTALTFLSMRNVEFGYAYRIPTELGNLKNLDSLILIGTQFIGDIPLSLGGLTKLTVLSIIGNRINGGIPPTFGNLKALTSLNLADNGLKTIGSQSITKLKKLEFFDLSSNKLSGYIPTWLGGLTISGTLDLGINPYSGPIPGALCNIKGLRRLNIYLTQVTAIPKEIGNCKTLENLQLFENKLRGNIPAALGLLKNLESISLGSNSQTGNKLTGTLPPSIGDLPKLLEFNIANNKISGRIPPNYGPFVEDEGATSFSGNDLTGAIPPPLSTLPAKRFQPRNKGLCNAPLARCK